MCLFPGPCSFSDCQDYYGSCTVAQDGSGTAKCQCPSTDQCPSAVRAICGDDGKTYPNKCRLEATSCQLKKRIEVKRKGACSKYRDAFVMAINVLSKRNRNLSKTSCSFALKLCSDSFQVSGGHCCTFVNLLRYLELLFCKAVI